MGRKCYVAYCKSGYESCRDEKVSMFSAPNDPELYEKWKKAIPREDRILQRSDYVCEKHFAPHCIIRHHKIYYADHFETFPLKRPQLHSNAIPTIFPNCPEYSTNPNIVTRKRNSQMPKEISSECSELIATDVISPTAEETLNENLTEYPKNNAFCFNDLWDYAAYIDLPDASWAMNMIGARGQRMIIFLESVCFHSNVPIVRKQVWISESVSPLFPQFSVYNRRSDVKNFGKNIQRLEDVQNYIKQCHFVKTCFGGPKITEFESTLLKHVIKDEYCGVWRHVDCNVTLQDCECESCEKCSDLHETLTQPVMKPKKKNTCTRVRLSPTINATRKVRPLQTRIQR